MQLSTEKILAEVRDGVGWLTINNAERRNAISLDMWIGMGEAMDAFATDNTVRCVVMTGAGDKAFASGADISQFEKQRSNAQAAEEYAVISKGGRAKIQHFEKPLIARIHGFCMGGGLGLAMAADIRIATETSVFAIPAARLSIAYDMNNVQQLVGLVGPSRAKEILITARRYSGDEAAAMGLVNRSVPVANLDDEVADLTSRIVENAPLSMRASKLTVNQVMRDRAERDMDLVSALSSDCFDSNDYKEGRQAFMEKRKPVFTGT
jgi:enoyl-CoA hydratase/carnithine racemase